MTTPLFDRGLAYLSPGLALSLQRWRQRRARDRQKLERLRDGKQLAIAEPPREPRTVDSIWTRMNANRRQPWQRFADELAVEQRAWHQRLGRHRGTSARDNFARPYPYDR
jgi:hypothetical protein